MQMTKVEIAGSYRRAADKKNQIAILAQLNGCDEDKIKSILLDAGIAEDDLPKKPGRKSGKKEDKKVAGEKTTVDEPVVSGKDMLPEYPKLTPEEEKQVDRALAIPEPVRIACAERLEVLKKKIAELEKERDCIEDYLVGVVRNG